MGFMFAFIVFAVFLQIAIYIAETTDILAWVWFPSAFFLLGSYFIFKTDFLTVIGNLHTIQFIEYFAAGLVFAILKLFLKPYFQSRKLKSAIRKHDVLLTDNYIKTKFLEKFITTINFKSNPPFSMSIENICYKPNSESRYSPSAEKSPTLKIEFNKINIATKLTSWTVFWPLFLINFAIADALNWLFRKFTNAIFNIYKNFTINLFKI